jgi:hypothetical protein
MFIFERKRVDIRKNENMGLLGDFAKGFVIMIGVFWVFFIIEFIYMKLYAFALLFLITLMIPLSMIAVEYFKNRKEKRT